LGWYTRLGMFVPFGLISTKRRVRDSAQVNLDRNHRYSARHYT
jgi:hypothetical protein